MADEQDEGAWAFDVVGALKARVEAVRTAEAALQAKARELEEDRETLEAARGRLAEKEQSLLRLEEELTRQKEGLQDRQSGSERAQTALSQAQERQAANETRLKEWAQSLHVAEQQIVSLRDELKARQAEATMKLAQFHDRLVAVMRREDSLVDREATLAESLQRLKKVNEAILSREKILASQVQALGELQKDWSSAVRKREDEFARALATLGDQSVAQGGAEAELATLIRGLQEEAEKLATQRQALLVRERKVIEFEQSLTSMIGAIRTGAEGLPVPGAVPAEPPAPAPAERPPQAASAERAQPPRPETDVQSPKGRAMEKMTRVLELAKKAQVIGRDNDEVRNLLRQIRKAYESRNWEEVDALCERAVEKLGVLTEASS